MRRGHFTLDNWPVLLEGDYHLADWGPGSSWRELAAAVAEMPAEQRTKEVRCILGFDTAERRAIDVSVAEASEVVRDSDGDVVLRKGDRHLW